jgi:Carboxypeptidase regulatory-like domain
LTLSSAARAIFVSASFLIFSTALFGQSERGTISGTVTDASGAAVPQAKVNAINIDTNIAVATVTNETGDYALPNLAAGKYTIRVEKEGFTSAAVTGITLDASSSVRADAHLTVGSTRQTVEVMAAAVQLQTSDAKTSSTVTNQMVDQLPLVVGGALWSASALPGASPAIPTC